MVFWRSKLRSMGCLRERKVRLEVGRQSQDVQGCLHCKSPTELTENKQGSDNMVSAYGKGSEQDV